MSAHLIDEANAAFWNELCGSSFARALGIKDRSAASLRRFDEAYLDLYPYLLRRVPVHTLRGQSVLEIGLGYGTLGQKIAESGADYVGLDIAAGPVDMMNHRLRLAELSGKATQGSMLDCPLADESVDCVVSIGCFHHTGNLRRCIDETWRVLRPGGRAFVMVYNRFSYRQWLRWPRATLRAALGRSANASSSQRKAYDANAAGDGAPETAFTSLKELRDMFDRFGQIDIRRENADHVTLRGRTLVPRGLLLGTLGRAMGLDLYASAQK